MSNFSLNFPVSDLIKSQQLSFIASLNHKASILSQQGNDVLKLSGGDPTHYPEKLLSIIEEIGHTPDHSIFSYSPIAGFDHLCELLAKVISIRYFKAYHKNNILVCSGGCSGLFLTFKAILNAGDRVLIQDPCWEYLPRLIENCGGIPVKMNFFSDPLQKNDWDKLIQEIENHLKLGVKIVSINSPLNPTGVIIPVEIKNKLIMLCEKYEVWFASDDVTTDFNYIESSPAAVNNSPYFISVNSFSKNLGITGLRFGFVAANDELINQIKKVQLYTCMYPNSLIQRLIERYLSSDINQYYEFIEKIVSLYKIRSKEYTTIFSDISGMEIKQPEGGLFLFPKIKNGYHLSHDKLLEQHYVAVAPGEAFSEKCKNYFRVFIGVEKSAIMKAKQMIQVELNDLSSKPEP